MNSFLNIKYIIKNNILFILLRSFRNSLEVTLNKKKNNSSLIYLYQIFIIRFLYGLTFFRNLLKTSYKFTNSINKFSFRQENLSDLIYDLDKKGFTYENKFKTDITDNIEKSLIANCYEGTIIDKNQKLIFKKNIRFKNLEEMKNIAASNNAYIFKGVVDINNSKILKKIFLSDFFLKLAKNYLSTNKLSINSQIFVSQPIEKNQYESNSVLLSKAAQKYHFDIDYKKFFKIIIYLSNVIEKENGAHIFIPGTHKFKLNKHMISKRYEDHEIEDAYEAKKIFLGDRGTYFCVDTFGYHKGYPVSKDMRIAAFIEYGKGHFQFNDKTLFVN